VTRSNILSATMYTLSVWLLCVAICLQGSVAVSTSDVTDRQWMLEPTVMIAVLVRNKAHTLPWFLYYLQSLDYPKQRIRLWYFYNFC